jgi:hypothetical protein
MLDLGREMGDLGRWEFDMETCLDILTTVAQEAVGVVASPPALLVDRLRALPDHVQRAVCVEVHRGASEALDAADTQSDEPWLSFVLPGWPECYDVNLRLLCSLEFTRSADAISDIVDVDKILRGDDVGGAGSV